MLPTLKRVKNIQFVSYITSYTTLIVNYTCQIFLNTKSRSIDNNWGGRRYGTVQKPKCTPILLHLLTAEIKQSAQTTYYQWQNNTTQKKNSFDSCMIHLTNHGMEKQTNYKEGERKNCVK